MHDSAMIENITSGIGAHGAWKLRLKTAIATGQFDQDAATVACDDKCGFGQWLYGESISPETRAGMPYQVIRRLHAEFHTCAARVVRHATGGHTQEARALLEGEYTERSEKLGRALVKWKRELGG